MTRLLPVLDRLGDVGDADLWFTRQIRNRARHLEHSRIAARREAERTHRPLQQAGAAFVVAAVFPDLTRAHLRVTVDRRSLQAHALRRPRALNPRSHGRRPLPQRRRDKFIVRQRRHLDVQVDAVEQRPGNARTVLVNVVRRAAAGMQAVPPEAALAPLRSLFAISL
jgi:hypothetical protein